ncbi:MAG: sulfurtransferase [Deltaproteobacteria bacterium]|jgi:rhodanese-related sulfurtransferase|nr:sulfurtransferase [Deltaproteobacteria bacterium]
MSRIVISIVLGALVAAGSWAGDPKPGGAPSISIADLHAQREAGAAPAVIDVRTAGEYASGHIPGAINIPFDEVAERIGEVEAPHGVALYCMVGPRALKGESALLAAGYETVFHIEGGLAAWQAAGLPVEGTGSTTP